MDYNAFILARSITYVLCPHLHMSPLLRIAVNSSLILVVEFIEIQIYSIPAAFPCEIATYCTASMQVSKCHQLVVPQLNHFLFRVDHLLLQVLFQCLVATRLSVTMCLLTGLEISLAVTERVPFAYIHLFIQNDCILSTLLRFLRLIYFS